MTTDETSRRESAEYTNKAVARPSPAPLPAGSLYDDHLLWAYRLGMAIGETLTDNKKGPAAD